MSHPSGGHTKDYHDDHDSATTSAGASLDCVSLSGGGLTTDYYYDDHDSATTSAAADSDCVLHPGGGLTMVY